jgi:outer membrane protein OmpA-like peptidoglycan-associated protein/uncharacterized protein YidB (DUF937 family)
MARLDELTDDIAERFDLGPKAPALVQEVLGLISAQPEGIGGFLNKVEAADLEEKVASWVGSPYPMALSVVEVKKALGAEAIKTIAKNAGLTENFACKVLGYAIPKIISLLAADGAFSGATSASSPSGVGDSIFGRERDILMHEMAGAGAPTEFRLVVPGAALLITLGLVGYFIKSGTAGDLASVQFPSSVSVAQNAPAAASQTPSQLLPGNETTASGENATGATTGPQKQVLGSGQTAGDFAVKTGWIQNLRAASGGFGSHVRFAGTGLNEETTRALGNRTWRIGSLWWAEVPQFVVATLTGSGPARISLASPAPALASSGTESAGLSKLAEIHFPTIIFPPNSTRVQLRSIPLLRRVAEQIKQLPAGTVVQIEGYTQGAARPTVNAALSQSRADSVYRILVREGVSPPMLTAKGYGSSQSVASNEITEGRSSKIMDERGRPRDDRRVKFRVVQPAP